MLFNRSTKKLNIGFVPHSDSQLLSAIPICREFKRRGHNVLISLPESEKLSNWYRKILNKENVDESPIETLKRTNLDVHLFNSINFSELSNKETFRFDMIAGGAPIHDILKLRCGEIYSGSNFAISPCKFKGKLRKIYKEQIPIIGIPCADLYTKNKKNTVNKKTILYPDGLPFCKQNREKNFTFLESLARKYPDYEVIIKERFPNEDIFFHYPYLSYKKNISKNTPGNLKVVTSDELTHHLAENASYLIGIQSGVLWQGLLNDKNVIMLSPGLKRERISGVNYLENDFFTINNLRADHNDILNSLDNCLFATPEKIQQEVPYLNASERITDVIEYIFSSFNYDNRLPYIKFDFEYSDSFNEEIDMIRNRVEGKSVRELQSTYHLKHFYYNTISEIISLSMMVKPGIEDEELYDFFASTDFYDQVIGMISFEKKDSIYSFIKQKKIECFERCVDRFYHRNNNDIIFDDFHIIELRFLKYGGYVYNRLLDTGKDKCAKEYYELLQKKIKSIYTAYKKPYSDSTTKHIVSISYSDINLNKFNILEESGKYKEAICILKQFTDDECLTIDQRIKLQYEAANIFLNVGRNGKGAHEARDFLKQLTNDNRISIDLRIATQQRIADILKEAKRYSEALEILKSLPDNSSGSAEQRFGTMYRIASVFEGMSKFRKSQEIFYKLSGSLNNLEVEPRYHYGTYFHLGKNSFFLNEFKKSRHYLERCLSICPDHMETRKLIAQLPDQ